MVDSTRLTVISSGRSELDEALVIYARQRGRFMFKSTCSLAFLRIVDTQESAE